jgi:DNA polymerase-3 subunit gamma/tau
MNHQALYRRYRPKTFDDVVEQQHVVTTLKNTVISGKPAHAYLFCGTRGTGKTTMAKILARAVNCLEPEDGNPCNKCEVCTGILSGTILDVIEMDAASNNSVDNVRDIIDEMVYTPSQASYKIYIIDEVHMLSSGAFNALLKTLEEPPEHVLFILATTEPNKLPATVLSRCQRFDFRRISTGGIMERLLLIAKETGINLTDEAAYFLASLAEGALRAVSVILGI